MKEMNLYSKKLLFLVMLGFVGFMSFICFTNNSYASIGVYHRDLKNLKYEIDDKIYTMNEMMNSINDSENVEGDVDSKIVGDGAICSAQKRDQMYFLNSMWLRFTAEVTLRVAIVSIRVAPSFGFIWGRANPNGWKNY
ncbi:MAG: hypothetical protein HQK49_17525 [Oligoflexia bacterium]|nr:hypothetical protein [Oligoflexia bacterium]